MGFGAPRYVEPPCSIKILGLNVPEFGQIGENQFHSNICVKRYKLLKVYLYYFPFPFPFPFEFIFIENLKTDLTYEVIVIIPIENTIC